FLCWYCSRPRARVPLQVRGLRLQREAFARILRVGLLACLSALQSVATVLVLSALVARHGVEALRSGLSRLAPGTPPATLDLG
ncbi:MAG TPA: hypothetical protein VND21_10720, partial [Planctomycetota bacterium]|nr:hypothetical protein [Planctomycetota bacterium]